MSGRAKTKSRRTARHNFREDQILAIEGLEAALAALGKSGLVLVGVDSSLVAVVNAEYIAMQTDKSVIEVINDLTNEIIVANCYLGGGGT